MGGIYKQPDSSEMTIDHSYLRLAKKCISYHGQLREALKQVSASIAWHCHGDCRAFHSGKIISTSDAVNMSKDLLKRLDDEWEKSFDAISVLQDEK